MKTYMSEFIWYMLVGVLTISISYNFIINTACENSIKEMQARYDKHNENIGLQNKAKETAPKERSFSSFE